MRTTQEGCANELNCLWDRHRATQISREMARRDRSFRGAGSQGSGGHLGKPHLGLRAPTRKGPPRFLPRQAVFLWRRIRKLTTTQDSSKKIDRQAGESSGLVKKIGKEMPDKDEPRAGDAPRQRPEFTGVHNCVPTAPTGVMFPGWGFFPT